ncbi:MAG TPA: endo-1,4-beta-xylanase [Rhizomicrobium sp.]|nr:endo-1,4-beta-xylanase [Rhizomicrobium sp.]
MNRISRRETIALGLAAVAGACTPMSVENAPDGLNALAAQKGLRFGSCLGTGGGAKAFEGKFAGSFDDPAVCALTVTQCGILVPENELKWVALRPDAQSFDFRRADILIDFAEKNGLAMRGHTLLWNRAEWFPKWVASYDFGSNPAAEAERLLREHITTVCRRYGNRVFAWDVVNETIDHDTGEMRETPFTKYLGPQAIDIAFDAARAAAPQAQLVYNDYMSWGADSAKHRAGVLRLLERLKKKKVPVDALGVQSHIGPGATDAGTTFSAAEQTEWRGFIDEATGMGLDIVMTEFDVGDQTMPADIAARDAEVAALARGYLDLMLDYRRLRYMMAWGPTDKYSWLQGWWPRKDGLPKRPCPYDDQMRPKPLREAIADAFRAAPARPAMETA